MAVAVILVGLGLPRFDALIARERRTAAVNQIIGAIQFSRAAAFSYRARVVLCPATMTDSGSRSGSGADPDACASRDLWHQGALIFIDDNRDGLRNGKDRILRRLPGWNDGSRVRWRSFRNRSYLVFRARGITDWQNGSFTWCPAPDQRPPLAPAQVVINSAGRTRTARDTDGDGIPENSSGQPVRC